MIQVFYNPFSGEKEKWRGGGVGGLGKIAICSQGVQLDSAMVLTTHSLHFFSVINCIFFFNFTGTDMPPVKRTLSKDGELRKEYEEEMRKASYNS